MLLALDTATAVGSAALLEMERVVAACYFDIGLMHSRRIFVAIDQMIQDAACDMDQIDVVGVSIGPGSYTGLRIGLGAAKGFCLTGKRSLIAVSTLETLAARLPYARHPVCALLDARNERVYTALYDTTAGYPTELSPPRAGNLAEVLEERAGQATIFTGDGAWVYRSHLEELPYAKQAPFTHARPDAVALGGLAWRKLARGEQADIAACEPEYLRQPSYERSK
jgi:tRNA threonylcarbamoyladenosine biosynthesis protein TsaB